MKSRITLSELKFEGKCEGNDSELSHSSLSTISSSDLNLTPKERKRRNRKNHEQIKVLIAEFEENAAWSKDFIQELSIKTGLSQAQIYKWNWDYRKKCKKCLSGTNAERLVCCEYLAPLQFDKDVLVVQRLYKMGFAEFGCETRANRLLFN